MADGRLIDQGKPRHYCGPPGWRHRRRLGVEDNAIWECSCGVSWIWNRGGDRAWDRHYNWNGPLGE